MKQFRTANFQHALVALLVLLVFASVGRCEEAEMWAKFSRLMLRDGGIAVGEGVLTEAGAIGGLEAGDKFIVDAAFALAEMPTALVGRLRLTIAGKPDVELTAYELYGWDPAKKTIDIVAYWSDNSLERISFDRCDGDTFFGRYSTALPTGKTESSDVAFVFKEDGTADFNFTSGSNKGKTLSSWKWTDEPNDLKALESYGDFMVGGVWKSTVKERELVDEEWVPTGNTLDLVHRYRWLEDKKVLELSGSTNGEQNNSAALIGINPETKRCTWWGFGKNGPIWWRLTLESEGVWVMSGGPFVNPEGDIVTWKSKLVRHGKDELHLEPQGRTKNGVPQEPTGDGSVWSRHEE